MKTFAQKPKDVRRKWYLLDASEVPLGRLSTAAARLLLGKDKPSFTPHVDGGDYVVIVNADSLVVTGAKATDKAYYRHSGHPGGLHKRRLEEQMAQNSTKVITSAVRGMLPVNKLRPARLARLKIYTGSEHQNTAQQPTVLSLKKGGN